MLGDCLYTRQWVERDRINDVIFASYVYLGAPIKILHWQSVESLKSFTPPCGSNSPTRARCIMSIDVKEWYTAAPITVRFARPRLYPEKLSCGFKTA